MPRQIVDLEGLIKILPLTKNQAYKLIRGEHPIPYKRVGRRLTFDVEKVYRWWDSLPGADRTTPDDLDF